MTDPHFERALALIQVRPELAEPELRLALAADPNHALAHSLLGLCLVDREQWAEATAEAEQAVHLAPDEPFGHYVLARIYVARNRPKQAEPIIAEALRLDPYSADHFGLLSQVHLQLRRWREALEAAESGLALDPEHVLCNNLRARALVLLGRKEEAGQTIAATLARDPDDPFTHANQGWTALEQGDPPRAMEHFRESLRLDPNCEWARIGIIEAMKAHHFVYRVMLAFLLWVLKLDTRVQWALMVGSVFVPSVLNTVTRAIPLLSPLFWPLYFAYMLFAVMTWVADPLFNLVLRLNRFGRLALSRDQSLESLLVGLCMATSIAVAVWGFAADSLVIFRSGMFLVLTCLPLSVVFKCQEGWPRWALAGVTLALFLMAASLLVPGSFVANATKRVILENFNLAALGSQFLAISLARREVRH